MTEYTTNAMWLNGRCIDTIDELPDMRDFLEKEEESSEDTDLYKSRYIEET